MLASIGLRLSLNDRLITAVSQFICSLGPVPSAEMAVRALTSQHGRIEEIARATPAQSSMDAEVAACEQPQQMALPLEFQKQQTGTRRA
jgi:hypothetical protein